MRPGLRRSTSLAGAATAVLLVGCGVPLQRPTDVGEQAPPGPTREHWALSHRVPGSTSVRVVGQRVDAYAESTTVSLGRDASGAEVRCSVSVSAPGWGGPENMVGEKVPTTVQGRPAVRNGAGAEGDYLIWQRADGAWTQSMCEDEGQSAFQDRLAEIVVDEPSEILLPFDVSLPAGLEVSSVEQDVPSGETTVRLAGAGRVGTEEGALVLSFDGELDQPEGRKTVINGRPAMIDETARFPGVCLDVQGHDVCVRTDASDTGPYPDRSAELPMIMALAESLRFPDDLEDRSSWTAAQDVFG
ncbi:hypothetical protein [Microlunatus antarcticus]|uniref:Lipoprotein n=1 Tax=Microlunatus antarcticus TaxID=53388 RepID=A0A7W5JX64_9ACTN|nr:hypothetical protein [Microlunatus antarcticus]MBB3327915.1 hypothetical protein [Microlunatus antarcticus]